MDEVTQERQIHGEVISKRQADIGDITFEEYILDIGNNSRRLIWVRKPLESKKIGSANNPLIFTEFNPSQKTIVDAVREVEHKFRQYWSIPNVTPITDWRICTTTEENKVYETKMPDETQPDLEKFPISPKGEKSITELMLDYRLKQLNIAGKLLCNSNDFRDIEGADMLVKTLVKYITKEFTDEPDHKE